jgi:hypothetical protein
MLPLVGGSAGVFLEEQQLQTVVCKKVAILGGGLGWVWLF